MRTFFLIEYYREALCHTYYLIYINYWTIEIDVNGFEILHYNNNVFNS